MSLSDKLNNKETLIELYKTIAQAIDNGINDDIMIDSNLIRDLNKLHTDLFAYLNKGAN